MVNKRINEHKKKTHKLNLTLTSDKKLSNKEVEELVIKLLKNNFDKGRVRAL